MNDSEITNIQQAVQEVYDVMAERVSSDELAQIKDAFEFANEAHKNQKRKTGQPYIIHPIAVALIAAKELKLDAHCVMTAFLHDVVEDTEYTNDDIKKRFGEDVAYLVDTVTKKKKSRYKNSKQVDNYEQLLGSIHYDIRALMVKIADRLHNMRTLQSMRPDKQMKIAGETDYFYAPLANRLGLFDVKSDLENLSFKYRCPHQYFDIVKSLNTDMLNNKERLDTFTNTIGELLKKNNIEGLAEVYYRRPYSIWRRMKENGCDFIHVPNRYYVRVTFTKSECCKSEKDVCLKIYSILTDVFKEKTGSFNNLIDQAKENSYQSLNVMLLSAEGVWEDVQICSKNMVDSSKLGCMTGLNDGNIDEWIKKFQQVLKDIANSNGQMGFMENVATTLYYDDVMVFTPKGMALILPKGSTAIDFAFELDKELGLHAKYARINGNLCSLKTTLKRGDCVEIGVVDVVMARPDWVEYTSSYKAKSALRELKNEEGDGVCRCKCCHPLPGDETIGFLGDDGNLMIHKRSCPEIIRDASKYGDSVVEYTFRENMRSVYPVTIDITAIDRYHLLMDILQRITQELHLSIESLNTESVDNIARCTVTFFVHSVNELIHCMHALYEIEGVDEVKQKMDG